MFDEPEVWILIPLFTHCRQAIHLTSLSCGLLAWKVRILHKVPRKIKWDDNLKGLAYPRHRVNVKSSFSFLHHTAVIKIKWGLPWWRSGWESACQCRGHGFKPWSGKIPHAAEQLGPWATITEPVRLEPVLCNKKGRDNEKPVHRDEEWPPLAATRESPRTETKTPHSHK